MGIYAVKPAFQRTLLPVQNILIERGVHPDAITLGALAISAATGLALSQVADEPRWLLLAPAAALGRTALNALDGLVAKAPGKARPWGEVLNEFSDRLADVALLGGLGSVQGAVIAAVILGFAEALTSRFLGGQYVLITQFLVIITILILRPRGIAGILDKAREQ